MKKLTLMIAGLGIAAATVPTVASAQSWQTINSRQASLDRRIDLGIRNRSLSRNEAIRLRTDFRALAQLETRYRRGGLSLGERRDLDRRFDALSNRIQTQRHDYNRR